jgi:hypothetical protein
VFNPAMGKNRKILFSVCTGNFIKTIFFCKTEITIAKLQKTENFAKVKKKFLDIVVVRIKTWAQSYQQNFSVLKFFLENKKILNP